MVLLGLLDDGGVSFCSERPCSRESGSMCVGDNGSSKSLSSNGDSNGECPGETDDLERSCV